MMEKKVIIAGSRHFDDYLYLREICDEIIHSLNCDIEIVSGGAKGADQLGEKFAEEFGFPVKRFPADWDTHGKAAGPIRNRQMAEYADVLIAFWDCNSKGTKNMALAAKELGLEVHVIPYE